MTATDYIFEQLEDNSLFFRGTDNELNISISASDYLDLKRLAKEMEKQQIIDGFGVGCHHESKRLVGYQDVAEQYYNETYGSKGSDDVKKKDRTCNNSCSVVCGECQIWGISDDCEEVKNWDSFVHKKNQELTSSQTEISDEEIEKWASNHIMSGAEYFGRVLGAKWYREQLKQRQ